MLDQQFSRKQRSSRHRSASTAITPVSAPVWPLPSLNGRAPVVLPISSKTPGIDLAYERAYAGELLAMYPLACANGSPSHFMPNHLPAFVVRDGFIKYAGKMGHGYAIVVDHRNGWATYYANLEHMFAMPMDRYTKQPRVKAGDVLGYVGSPTPGAFKCLHFELWEREDNGHLVPVDPSEEMRSWTVLPWSDERLTPPDVAINQAAAA